MMKAAWLPLTLIAIVGCSKAPALHVANALPATLPSGWTEGKSRDGLVSLAIPGGWRAGADRASNPGDLTHLADQANSNPGDSSASAAIQELNAEMAKIDKEMEERQLADLENRGIVFQAVSSGRPVFDEARTRFHVVRKTLDKNAGWAEATDWERKHYAFPPKPQEVTLPIGKAYRFSADDKLRNGSDRHEISYVVIESKDIYALRFITQEDASVISQIAEPVAKTWRIKPRAETK